MLLFGCHNLLIPPKWRVAIVKAYTVLRKHKAGNGICGLGSWILALKEKIGTRLLFCCKSTFQCIEPSIKYESHPAQHKSFLFPIVINANRRQNISHSQMAQSVRPIHFSQRINLSLFSHLILNSILPYILEHIPTF